MKRYCYESQGCNFYLSNWQLVLKFGKKTITKLQNDVLIIQMQLADMRLIRKQDYKCVNLPTNIPARASYPLFIVSS